MIRSPDLRPVKPWRMMARGLRRRCPRCNGSGWWTGWLQRVSRCRSCGYRYEREDGFSLGAITINMMATFLLLGVVFAVGFFLSYPGEPHHLAKKENQKDFQIRMRQWFDHYLMDKPAPKWMTDGVPQTKKGGPLQ